MTFRERYLTCPFCGKMHPRGILAGWRIMWVMWRTCREMHKHPERSITLSTPEEITEYFDKLNASDELRDDALRKGKPIRILDANKFKRIIESWCRRKCK